MMENKKLKDKRLNILNGQSMYDYFSETGLALEGEILAFNEAMCAGEVTEEIFSREFIQKRCAAHHVSFDDYKEKIIDKLLPLFKCDFSEIHLWFGSDMFCQINLLTLLAYLEQSGFKGAAVLVLVNESERFEKISETRIELGRYCEIYKNVLIKRVMPRGITPQFLKEGIRLYLNLFKENNEIVKYIREHKNIETNKLVSDLTGIFPQYGLGDIQYLELIRKTV